MCVVAAIPAASFGDAWGRVLDRKNIADNIGFVASKAYTVVNHAPVGYRHRTHRNQEPRPTLPPDSTGKTSLGLSL